MAYDFSKFKAKVKETEEWLKKELSNVRTGRASAAILDSIKIESYGSMVPITPVRTIVSRGITKGDECTENLNKAETGDCLKVEQFDSIEVGIKGSQGAKSKQIILFFDIPATTQANSGKPADAKLIKIKTKVLMDNFQLHQKINLEVIDTEPNGKPNHDEKIFVIKQIDDYPMNKNLPLEGKTGIGKFRLDTFDNTDPEPIRFLFKKQSYLKSLILFEKLLTKIYDSNDLSGNNRAKTTVEFQKKSLEY
jgi:hypothetical protein